MVQSGFSAKTGFRSSNPVHCSTDFGGESFKVHVPVKLEHGKIDLPLDGYAYTWAHKIANKMSDENTNFFHAIINSKCSQLAICGTLVDGEWIVDPLAVKRDKEWVLDCGTNKSPGHDGFSFEFFHRYWKLLEHDIVVADKDFFALGLFSGILIDSLFTLSDLFFADDAIFVDKWDSLNIRTIVNVLKCFHLAFGFTKAIYGEDGALNSLSFLSKRSHWLDIIREVTVLRKKVGNGLNTLFWGDHWLEDLPLKHTFLRLYALNKYKQIIVVKKINNAFMVDTFRRPPRGGAEEVQLSFLLSRLDGLILKNTLDCWVWSLEATGEFSLKSVHQLIANLILPKEEVTTRKETYVLVGGRGH
nr:hypothetical protein [Tanacetum cinerariifolium]